MQLLERLRLVYVSIDQEMHQLYTAEAILSLGHPSAQSTQMNDISDS